MLHFQCPDCREPLEAEEDVRGTRMKCPACWKEIAVPAAGGSVPGAKAAKTPARLRVVLPPPGPSRAGPVALVAAIVALFAAAGGIGVLSYRRATEKRPPPAACAACQGTRRAQCTFCSGARRERCTNRECQGGTVTNYRGEPEECATCGGKARIACRSCGGAGEGVCVKCAAGRK